MRDAANTSARVALDAGNVLKRSELRERGWTNSMVERLLVAPDMTLPNPRYRSGAPMRLYLRARVEAIEATPDFERMRHIGAQRAERSKAIATKRATHLVAAARSYSPWLPATLDYQGVLDRAIRAYNTENMHRDRFANHDSEPAFLARLTWNYFRHHLTDWDQTWDGFSGKPGVRDAYLVAADALITHACARFPTLHAAAVAWLERKRSHAAMLLAAQVEAAPATPTRP